ncbi:S7 family peptidase [Gracilibacillus halophilus YIM-C55.5]|uniref:S7 family peptidase n=1 Tax=Gracilibacillus halophilus YIM-C55.5 TaxID=1308866 RepID=N4WSY1_9BACI|nr:serine protease [Gracilibacillus halophilus]ENH96276.1 S7 family peptidase [Gracilibacillus halophilus YIM-C55.5]
MRENEREDNDIIDDDLYEDLEHEEMYELVQEERRKLQEKQQEQNDNTSKKRLGPRWLIWGIAIAMFIQVIAIIPQTFSIPAINFLKTSASLMQDSDVQTYREGVVVVSGDNNKGTGFAISEDGYIMTNHHVVEDQMRISVAFQEKGQFQAEIMDTWPAVDLALLKVDGENLPYLPISDAKASAVKTKEDVLFIGNPLAFTDIANQGDLIGMTTLDDWERSVYMLDAPVYRGNSGSPVIDENGQVIAVIFATIHKEEHGRVGLAVPIEAFRKKIDSQSYYE